MKTEGIYFIDLGTESNETVNDLRGRILENTRHLMEVLNERSRLAEELTAAKLVTGIPLRDREQEIRVMSSSGDLSLTERRILNMIFEFTISVQERKTGIRDNMVGESHEKPFEIRGEPFALSYLAGLLVSMPGREIYCNGNPDASVRMGIVDNGGHLIDGPVDSPETVVCLGFDDEHCSISLDRNGRMKIQPSVIANRNPGNRTMIEVADEWK